MLADHQDVFHAAYHGNIEAVKEFFEKGGDANAQETDGGTILHAAILGLSYEIVVLALEKGAKCNIPNEWGNTPLHRAISEGYTEERVAKLDLVIDVLIKNGADLLAQNKDGRSIVDVAKNFKNKKVLSRLKEIYQL